MFKLITSTPRDKVDISNFVISLNDKVDICEFLLFYQNLSKKVKVIYIQF